MAQQIIVIDKKSHARTELRDSDARLLSPSVVELPIPRAKVKSIARDGDSLVVTTIDGQVIVIHGFFNDASNLKSDLVLQDGDGALWFVNIDAANAANPAGIMTSIDSIDPLLVQDNSVLSALPAILGGVGLVAGGIAVAVGGGGGAAAGLAGVIDEGNGSRGPLVTVNPNGTLNVHGTTTPGSHVTVTWPDGSTSSTTADSSGNYSTDSGTPQGSGDIDTSITDPSGHNTDSSTHYTDITPPEAPGATVKVNPDGTLTVSGTAEAGSTVIVHFADGTSGSAVADASGNYSISSSTAQVSGSVDVTATDAAGNTSGHTIVAYTVAIAPPTVTADGNADGTVTVTGTGVPGATVTVAWPDGTTGTTTVGRDGTYSITSPSAQANGPISALETINGQTSNPTLIDYVDNTPPASPSVHPLGNPDGTVTVSGTAIPGSTVKVTFPDGTTATGTVGSDGHYSVTSPNPQGNGSISVIDTFNGKDSAPTQVGYGMTTQPQAPDATVTGNDDGTVTVSGTGIPGSTVTVKYPDGTTGTTTVGKDGHYTITSPDAQGDGTISVTDTFNGKTSEPTEIGYSATPPASPSVSAHGNPDGTVTVSGSGVAGGKITVTFPDGTTATGTVGSDGTYSITSPTPQLNGSISVTDTALGHTSDPTQIVYTDTVPPSAPTASVAVNQDGTVNVSGTAIPGSKVTVTFPDGTTASMKAGSDGHYSLTSNAPQDKGEITVVDTFNDLSSNPTHIGYNVTVPNPPEGTATDNPDGSITVEGSGDPGSEITVTWPDGTTGSTTVDGDGHYSITSPPSQGNGDITITETDNGQTSDATTLPHGTHAPSAPAAKADGNPDGTVTVSGTGVPGGKITVTFPDGTTATTTVGSDGKYSVTSPTPQGDGSIYVTDTVNGQPDRVLAVRRQFEIL
ncbi:Ig-like domain-containing protein [Paraburkholderia mimosarum]|uniref:Ig-like domain-containing protein n=1 Tax=Paraburkholderia mimosarum TaxID=312026 RepID=UPI0039C49A53